MRSFLFLSLSIPIFAFACSSGSTDTDASVDDSSVDTGSTTDAKPGTDAGADTGTDTGTPNDSSTVKDGPDDAYVPSAAAKYFCQGYKSLCGFGTTGYYADELSCQWAYDHYSLATETCVGNALGKSDCKGAACTSATCQPCN